MNHVERFRAVMNFQPFDRLPRIEWAPYWDLTMDRWHTEGLPAELTEADDIRAFFGLDPYLQQWFSIASWEVAEARPTLGPLTQDTYTLLRDRIFRPIDGALQNLERWLPLQQQGQAVVWITLEGFFWLPRALFGIEEHFYAFYDHRELLHRIHTDLADYHRRTLQEISKLGAPAFMTFAEDMSYNLGPMLSKELFDEFLAPYYRQIVPLLQEMNIIPVVDSDGDIAQLIPWLEEVGIHGFLPLERQAGVCAATLRQRHPRLRLIGHYDKMVMPQGEAAMRAEFERLLPVMRQGGFIPSVDHQTPPGVSLEQYRIYLRLLEEYTCAAAR